MHIIFVPGIWGGTWLFDNFLKFFKNRGLSASAVQLVNQPEHSLTFDEFLSSVVQHLHDSTESYVLVGHSAGALLALRAAESNPNVKATVLMSPAPPRGAIPIPPKSMVAEGLKLLPAVIRGKMVFPNHGLVMRNGMNCLNTKTQSKLWKKMVFPEHRRYLLQLGLRRISVSKPGVPTLVLGADRDLTIPEHISRCVSHYLQTEYDVLQDTGHFSPQEKHWAQTAEKIYEWIQKKQLQ